MSDAQKLWTFGEMLDKVQEDTDISIDDPDEVFVKFSEFIGYFNEAIDEAEAEICKLDEDYFLTRDYIPLVAGESDYLMPENVLADKIRGVVFDDGSERYLVKKMRRKNLFMNIAAGNDTNNASGAYLHYIRNDSPGQRRFVLVPPARESCALTIPPIAAYTPAAAPLTRWYIRNANRIPLVGDYVFSEDLLPADFNVATGAITVDPDFAYVTGDAVQFSLRSSAYALPAGLQEDTTYYVVRLSSTQIKLSTSLALARAASTGLVSGDRIQEIPAGAIDGLNVTFVLSETPYSDGSVQLYLDGVFQRQGTHYTIVGDTITMLVAPALLQELDATFYPATDDAPTTRPTEVQVVPTGAIDGLNVDYTLPSTPASAASVKLYVDGALVEQGVAYTISGRDIEFVTALAIGQTLDAVYDTAVVFFTDDGMGFFTLKVAATRAIIEAQVVDIPEFSTFIMEWVKANCLFKDGDPRLQGCIAKLEQQRKQMNDLLTEREPDDDNTVELDLSFYEDMN